MIVIYLLKHLPKLFAGNHLSLHARISAACEKLVGDAAQVAEGGAHEAAAEADAGDAHVGKFWERGSMRAAKDVDGGRNCFDEGSDGWRIGEADGEETVRTCFPVGSPALHSLLEFAGGIAARQQINVGARVDDEEDIHFGRHRLNGFEQLNL